MMADIERILDGGELIAIIIPAEFSSDETSFFTPPELSQQLGFITRRAGDVIQEHIHKLNRRNIIYTQEVLVVIYCFYRIDYKGQELKV